MRMRSRRLIAVAAFAAGVAAWPAGSHADDMLSKLSVHGFLTQAYGRASDKSATVLGIPRTGTSDYRTAALQFAYAISDKDRLVLQLSHERSGVDANAALRPDVALDWAFYQRRFSDSTTVKVGRLPIPLGIYNEIRDAGTVLPFFRPPDAFYSESTFFAENLDGVAVEQSFSLGRWGVDLEPFAGGWNTIAVSGSTSATPARVEDGFGANAWLRTPIAGLRVGGAAYRNTIRRPGNPAPAPEVRRVWQASVDASFSRVTARGEFSKSKDSDSRDRAYYGLLSLKPLDKVALNVQISRRWVHWFAGPRAGIEAPIVRDLAVGVNYEFRPDLILKVEGHDGEGAGIGTRPPVNRYFLVGLSASF